VGRDRIAIREDGVMPDMECVDEAIRGEVRWADGDVGNLMQRLVELVEAGEDVAKYVHVGRSRDLGGVEVGHVLGDRKAQRLVGGQRLAGRWGSAWVAHGHEKEGGEGGAEESQIKRRILPVLLPLATRSSALGASASG